MPVERVLVTGASGFVGRHLVNHLLNRGSRVVAMTRKSSSLEAIQGNGRIEIIEHDITATLQNAKAKLGRLDAIIHLAWSGLPNYTEPFHFETNLPANYRFLRELIQAGYRRLFVSGTCFEYGLQNGELDESAPTNPVTAYGLAKDCLFKFLRQLQTSNDFQLIWGRLFYLHGRGQSPRSLLSQLQRSIENRDEVFRMSGGEQLRDYLPVEEAVANIIKLIDLEKDIGAVNICSGSAISVRKFVEQWMQDNARSIKLDLGFYPYTPYEPFAFWGSRRKFDSLNEGTKGKH